MRILHLVHQYLPEHVGGTELYTQSLCRALSERGHQTAVFHRRSGEGVGLERRTSEHGPVYAAWNGEFAPTRRLLATFGDQTITSAFEQALDETGPDIVHVQHLMGLPTAVLDLLARRHIPYVVTLWDFWWVCANAQLLTNYSGEICDGPQAYLNCARCALARAGQPDFWPALPGLAVPLALRNRTLQRALSGAARLITPAAFVRDWYAGHGAPPDRMAVLPPGLDYPKQQPVARKKEWLLRIGYVGGLTPQKGVHTLVEAFDQLEAGAELWIAGDRKVDPVYSARLEAMAGPGVTFKGRLERTAVWQMLAEVDIVAVPSLWYETFVFVVSEAFAAGVPVVASDLGVLAERVTDGVDGLLAPPGDVVAWANALRRLQQEPALLARLQAGIGPVTTMDEHVTAVEEIYLQIAS